MNLERFNLISQKILKKIIIKMGKEDQIKLILLNIKIKKMKRLMKMRNNKQKISNDLQNKSLVLI